MNRPIKEHSITSNVAFLNDTIVSKGFQMNDFLVFLSSKKENGHDLSLWTMDELMNVAFEFQLCAMNRQAPQMAYDYQQGQYGIPQQPSVEVEEEKALHRVSAERQSYQQQQQPQMPGSMQQIVQQHMINQTNNLPRVYEVNRYYSVVPCSVLEVNPLSALAGQNLYATVNGYETVEGGVFSKAYIQYRVTLMPIGEEVKHRFKSFEMLRDYLLRSYPEYIIPPLPKKSGKSSKRPDIRMPLLERFLNRVIEQLEFRADPVVELFFSSKRDFQALVPDQRKQLLDVVVNANNDFGQLANNLEKVFDRSIDFEKVASPTGSLTLQISSQVDAYFQCAQENIKPQSDIIRKIRRQTKQVVAANSLLQTELKSLANLYSMLFFNHSQQNNKCNVGKNLKGEGVNNVLNNLFMRWSQKIDDQNSLFRKHIIDFYKFNLREYEGLSEIIDKQSKLKSEVNVKLNKLMSEKQKLFEKRNIDNWEVGAQTLQQIGRHNIINNRDLAFMVMLPRRSRETFHARDNFAYFNNKVFEQLCAVNENDARDTATNFIEFAVRSKQLFETPGQNFWEDVSQAMQIFGVDQRLLRGELGPVNRITHQRSVDLD